MTPIQQIKLVEVAKSLIGKPYKYGAKTEEAPDTFDCSSFTQYVFRQIGIELPRSSISQAADAKGEEILLTPDFSNLEIGDLLFMRGVKGHYDDELFNSREIYIGHVVIYIGDGEVVQASSTQGSIKEQNLYEIMEKSKNKIVIIKRW